jgi:hypothetical protein
MKPVFNPIVISCGILEGDVVGEGGGEWGGKESLGDRDKGGREVV